jgi:hypothetical protein
MKSNEPIVDRKYPPQSPLSPLFQRGEILPFAEGAQEGFTLGISPLVFVKAFYLINRERVLSRMSLE